MATLMVRDPFLAAPFRLLDEFFRTSGNGTRVTGFTPVLDVSGMEEGDQLDAGGRAWHRRSL
jgi:hypothetical protein